MTIQKNIIINNTDKKNTIKFKLAIAERDNLNIIINNKHFKNIYIRKDKLNNFLKRVIRRIEGYNGKFYYIWLIDLIEEALKESGLK